MASAELWPSSAENILYFGVQKRLRAFLYPIFTGGVTPSVAARQLPQGGAFEHRQELCRHRNKPSP